MGAPRPHRSVGPTSSAPVALFAVKPFAVGLTHGMPCSCALISWQSGGAAIEPATTRAWKSRPVLARNENVPAAELLTVPSRFSAALPFAPQIATVGTRPRQPALGHLAGDDCAQTQLLRLHRDARPQRRRQGRRRVPAWLTWPLPACHGVQNAIHAPCVTALKTPFTVSAALRNLAPNVAPPLSTGMSGGARQKRIFAGPSAVSAPAVGRT